MHPLEIYLARLREIRSSGAAQKETSYYGALENLFNEIGKSLKPRVVCNMQLKDQGAGIPDGGLFTEEQLKTRKGVLNPLQQTPARGVIEIKSTSDDAWVTADSKQVSKYWNRYHQVLITNYRDFVFVGQDSAGNPVKLETYRLADSDTDFWAATSHPKKTADFHAATFADFTKRTMRHAAPLSDPADVAWFLASYARDALTRISLHQLPALPTIRKALEEALGLRFEGDKGDHFFKSTLVQTLFYGVFSAWVLWSKHPGSANLPIGENRRFDWRLTAHHLRIPILQKLFYEVANPAQLDQLNLSEILDWTSAVLNRIDGKVFFDRFQEAHAVQYFYEPFLQAFDPDLRKQLGVWYTPPEIVKYMVARVDTVLREELDLPDGLADKNVYVLDPCCGTGSYLVEVLNKIHETLKSRGSDALIAADLKEAAQKRVFGFELLPAPFVVSHLQLGLLLQNLGAPLSEKGKERIGVYLTNALTGWEPPKAPKTRLLFPELEEERDAAEHVKRDTPILVILGNPPYNAFAGVSPAEEQGLVEPYKEGLVKEWKIKKFNLDDLYVRFFRLAERRIAEMSGAGVVSYISNHSWVGDPSFVVMRKHLLGSFDRFWIENMHGNRKISEYAPDGRTSETVFAIPGFSAGIQQGVAISLWVKGGRRGKTKRVLFRDDLDEADAMERRSHLLSTLQEAEFESHYTPASPAAGNRYSFRPQETSTEYESWPPLIELSEIAPMNGLMEKRGGVLMDTDPESLRKRMRAYFDRSLTWEGFESFQTGLGNPAAGYVPRVVRDRAHRMEEYDPEHVIRYSLRPLETRWCYYSQLSTLWNRPRPSLAAQSWEGNAFLLSRFNAAKDPEGPPFYFTRLLSDDHLLAPDASCFPIQLQEPGKNWNKAQKSFGTESKPRANHSGKTKQYLLALGMAEPGTEFEKASTIWNHVLAIGFSPEFLRANRDGIRRDWPRIPLPDSQKGLAASASLGRQIAALLDTESGVPEITGGKFRAEVRLVALPSRAGGGSLKESDLRRDLYRLTSPSPPVRTLFRSRCSLFCKRAKRIPFLFNHQRTLAAKHRGWHQERHSHFGRDPSSIRVVPQRVSAPRRWIFPFNVQPSTVNSLLPPLFCTRAQAISFPFRRFRTLCVCTRGIPQSVFLFRLATRR